MTDLPEHVPINRNRTSCAAKNDRLGWKDGLAVSWGGFSIGIRCNRADLLPEIEAMLPIDAQPCKEREVDLLLSILKGAESERRGTKNFHLVYEAWFRRCRTLDWQEALAVFVRTLQDQMALRARDRTYLEGSPIVCSGRQFIVLGSLKARRAIAEVFPGAPSRVSFTVPEECPPLALVLEEKTQQPSGPLSQGQAALELMRHATGARRQPKRIMDVASQLAQRVSVYRSASGWTRLDYEKFLASCSQESTSPVSPR